jgi:hypothetical protein
MNGGAADRKNGTLWARVPDWVNEYTPELRFMLGSQIVLLIGTLDNLS